MAGRLRKACSLAAGPHGAPPGCPRASHALIMCGHPERWQSGRGLNVCAMPGAPRVMAEEEARMPNGIGSMDGSLPGFRVAERWQSGRMRRIRNPVYGFAVTWV